MAIRSIDIFCQVIDNFGDIGVCWRLARQFVQEHSLKVSLWVDDLGSFSQICPNLQANLAIQHVSEIEIRRWDANTPLCQALRIPDCVIEGFGCPLPKFYLQAMVNRLPHPSWFNLEYLGFEEWVQNYHGLPSPQPNSSLVKYFFFPSIQEKAGGLIREAGLLCERDKFQTNKNLQRFFWRKLLGNDVMDDTIKISLFCYPDAPLQALFDALSNSESPVLCLVPEGVAIDSCMRYFGHDILLNQMSKIGALSVQRIPFLDQIDYDFLLWAADINIVRGEDSFVRAQWAAKPFLWNIYPQENWAHKTKLDSFCNLYLTGCETSISTPWRHMSDAINGLSNEVNAWDLQMLMSIHPHTQRWAKSLSTHTDLASSLIRFAEKMR